MTEENPCGHIDIEKQAYVKAFLGEIVEKQYLVGTFIDKTKPKYRIQQKITDDEESQTKEGKEGKSK